MTRRGARAAWVALLACLPLPATAAEMIVQGEVVDVVPISAAGAPARADCQPPRPSRHAGLLELLEWDLRARCPARAASAYRVYDRWDGRTYSQVMHEPPGETVSLRVRVR